jgi:hypothetical protein
MNGIPRVASVSPFVRPFALAIAAACFAVACASSGGSGSKAKDPGKGFQTLDATVIGRDHEAPGSGGSSAGGEGTYYLIFEATEGEAHATYRFPVTRMQYQRYPEGSHVQLSIANHELRDIRMIH